MGIIKMINSFSIYRDYYDLITILSEREQEKISLAIFKYMFEDIEPSFEGNIAKIFNNLKRPLEKSKNKSKNGSNVISKQNQDEIKTKSNENQNKIKIKSKQNQNEIKQKTHQDVYVNVNVYVNKIINEYKNIKNNDLIKNKILDWLEYKKERKDKYTEKGLKSMLSRIDNLLNDYEEQEIIELIDNSIVNNWKGIIWDNLKTKNKKTKEPSWFKNKTETEEMTKEEQEEMKKLLKDFK
jgi:hypothetical protein